MRIKTFVGMTRLDKDRQLIDKRVFESRSWTRHLFDLFFPLMSWTNLANVADIGSVNRTLSKNTDTNGTQGPMGVLLIAAPPGGAGVYLPWCSNTGNGCYAQGGGTDRGQDMGIVIGTSNTAVTPADNKLVTQINHGGAATQMLYGGCEVYGLTFVNPNGSMIIRRFFENVSGGGITVEEVGIYAGGPTSLANGYFFCIARDVTGGVVVADTELLEVTYTVQITV
jgi:hypothetical protein